MPTSEMLDDYSADKIAAMREMEEGFAQPKTGMRVLESEIAPGDYPVPTGYRLLIEPIKIEETTASGLVLPAQAVEAKEHLRSIGRVIAMGPLAYQHEKFQVEQDGAGPPVPQAWCKVGDFVAYATYSGHEIRVRNKAGGYTAVRLINDDEVMAVIPDPQSVLTYV